uniref:Uncharacterized protein n=1 Tax=Moniliophthora roreri TaxID=221103 RepID=A0A0W0FYK1_MONRR
MTVVQAPEKFRNCS